jgi:class 3 adenylate cyclase
MSEQQASCGRCGYAVTGLTTFTCPECGSDLREVGIVRDAAGKAGVGWVFFKTVGWKLLLAVAVFVPAAVVGVEYYAEHVHPGTWAERQFVQAVPKSNAYTSVEVVLSERTTVRGRVRHRYPPRVDARALAVDVELGSKHALFEHDALTGASRYRDATGVERTTTGPLPEALRAWMGGQGINVNDPGVAAEIDLIAAAVAQAGKGAVFRDAITQASPQPFMVRTSGMTADPPPAGVYYPVVGSAAVALGLGVVGVIWLRNRRRLTAALAATAVHHRAHAAASAAAPADGPTARTLSVMFSDVKDYTARTANESRLGVLDVVRRHRDLAQPIVKRRGGRVVKSLGDGLLVAFESATDAVLAGLEIQAAATAHSRDSFADRDKLELRIAVSTGEVALDGGDVFGEPVNLASRAQQQAAAGEVLFTEATFATINRREVRLEEAGTFELKGVAGPVRLYRAIAADDAARPPELRSGGASV